MRTIAIIGFTLAVMVGGCASPEPRKAQMQPLVGKSVREVADALHTPESQFMADDDPAGHYRAVTAMMIGPPYGRILSIFVSQQDAIDSIDRKVKVSELFDKRASGIEVHFSGTRRDICVGDAVQQYLK